MMMMMMMMNVRSSILHSIWGKNQLMDENGKYTMGCGSELRLLWRVGCGCDGDTRKTYTVRSLFEWYFPAGAAAGWGVPRDEGVRGHC